MSYFVRARTDVRFTAGQSVVITRFEICRGAYEDSHRNASNGSRPLNIKFSTFQSPCELQKHARNEDRTRDLRITRL